MEKAQLIRQVIELQHKVNRMLRRQVPDAWMELSLTLAQLKSLFFISSEGNTNVRKLAAALSVTSANVTGIVDRLVKQGLVTRRENPEDRRMLLLQVTDKGRALIIDLRERQISRLSEILDYMSPDEVSTLAQGLSSLLKACELCQKETRQRI
jgi:DNA-binding MarR family transcriptional regulator